MRALSRWAKRTYAEYRLGTRRRALCVEIGAQLGERVTLERAGSRGRDSIYVARTSDGIAGALRVVNPYLRRKALGAGMPFETLPVTERLDREWHCYAAGAKVGLTPRPVWRGEDALLCEYIRGERLSDRLSARPQEFWPLIVAGTRAIAALHCTGVTHMDASLANMVAESETERIVLIDFEYGPRQGLSAAEQRAYDHLRLLESVIKFMPAAAGAPWEPWIAALETCVDGEARHADITALVPALGRVLAAPHLRRALTRVFARM